MAFKAIKIKVTGEETEINQEKDFEFSDYEKELGAVETLNNFPAIYNGKTAMIMTTKLNDDKSVPINDKASSYYQKFLDMPETKLTKDAIRFGGAITSLKNLQTAHSTLRGLYVRGDCILVLQSGGTNA